MRGAFQPQAVSLEWHQSPEGQGVLAHLTDPVTGLRRQYGLIERPLLPPTVRTVNFKLFVSGKSGVGKTTLVSILSGISSSQKPSSNPGETPGLRVTQVYWPVKIRGQIFLFNLALWDSGEVAGKKYGHIVPVSRENACGGIFVFSFTDRTSFEDLSTQLAKVSQQGNLICPIIVGTRFGAITESEVTQQDIAAFEAKWSLPVLRIRNFQGLQGQLPQQGVSRHPNAVEVALILNIICDQVWSHQHQVNTHPSTVTSTLI